MAMIPTKDQIRTWIAENPHATSKRDIAKAFGIKGADRIDLKRILKDLEAEGLVEKKGKTYRDPDKLPPVAVLQVTAPDDLGDVFARPLEWQGDGPEPKILFLARATDPALGRATASSPGFRRWMARTTSMSPA
jgi:ribonuclease R